MPRSPGRNPSNLAPLWPLTGSRGRKIAVAVLIAIYGIVGRWHPPAFLSWSVWLAPTLRFPGYDAVLILLLLVAIAVSRVACRLHRESHSATVIRAVNSPIDDLLIAGLSLLCVPIVRFAASYFGPSTFASQYLIPASLGLAPAIAYVAWWSCTASATPFESAPCPPRQGWTAIIGWVALILFTVALPVVVNRRAPTRPRPGTEVEAVAPANATVVVENEGGIAAVASLSASP